MEDREKDYSKKIITVPNLLTVLRVLLIPLFLWTYLGLKNQALALGVLAFSFFTDFLDGYIARRYQMISDLGKAMDPMADKLNQASILVALSIRYPIMLIPFGIMVVKEVYLGILMLIVIRRSGTVFGADWHGKVATFLIYSTMALHLIWPGTIPTVLSYVTVGITVCMQLLSFVLYAIRNNRLVKEYKKEAPQDGAKE